MAKWGEGDPRWIVEERPDATNVNNWHWTEKNAAHWSKDKLQSLLMNLEVNENNIGKCFISEITSIEGEAVANNRKGKLIFFYEWVIKCQWKGNVNGDENEVTGTIEIPNLSEENNADEITIDVTLNSSGTNADILKELMRTKGQAQIRKQLSKYIMALRDEFARDMIKPTKVAEGGSINSFQTEVQQQKKKESCLPGIARSIPTPNPQPQMGVKIETVRIQLVDNFKCTADEFYRVLTDSALLQAFTQNKVSVDVNVGGQFSLLNGNIIGKFTHLEPNKCIKQTWRLRNWPAEHYSDVTIKINQKEDHTEVSIELNGVPRTHQEATEQGWQRHYIESIKRTFGFGASIF